MHGAFRYAWLFEPAGRIGIVVLVECASTAPYAQTLLNNVPVVGPHTVGTPLNAPLLGIQKKPGALLRTGPFSVADRRIRCRYQSCLGRGLLNFFFGAPLPTLLPKSRLGLPKPLLLLFLPL